VIINFISQFPSNFQTHSSLGAIRFVHSTTNNTSTFNYNYMTTSSANAEEPCEHITVS